MLESALKLALIVVIIRPGILALTVIEALTELALVDVTSVRTAYD
jgi:hypothetical protein